MLYYIQYPGFTPAPEQRRHPPTTPATYHQNAAVWSLPKPAVIRVSHFRSRVEKRPDDAHAGHDRQLPGAIALALGAESRRSRESGLDDLGSWRGLSRSREEASNQLAMRLLTCELCGFTCIWP